MLKKKQLIFSWVMVILLSGCSTTLNTFSPLERIEDLRKRVAYHRQLTQEFLDSLKRGMSKEKVFSLLIPLMDRKIAYVRYESNEVLASGKREDFQIAFTYEKDILFTFLNNALESWSMGD